MNRQLTRSADGSNTLKLEEFDESYHSMNGALAESCHIFIECGLKYYLKNLTTRKKPENSTSLEINIFEVGLGTGLNCLLTALYTFENKNVRIKYTGIEKFPISDEEFQALDHMNAIVSQNTLDLSGCLNDILQNTCKEIQYCEWEKWTLLLPNFSLLKLNSDLVRYAGVKSSSDSISLSVSEYDIVYFDAFSPNTQPELWSVEIFCSIYDAIKPGGILVTYCSKGIVKQALRESGFEVSRLPGPKGKRHIIRATKPTTCETYLGI